MGISMDTYKHENGGGYLCGGKRPVERAGGPKEGMGANVP